MRRLDDVGAAWRRELGEPAGGPPDTDLLAAVLARRRAVARRRRLVALVPAAAAAVLVVALLRGGAEPDPDTPSPSPPPVADVVPEPSVPDSTAAAILLESARLRLDGFGNPAAASPRLREVVRLHPGTRSARRAAELLEGIEGRTR